MEVGNHEGLRNAILKMVEDREETIRMGQKAFWLYNNQYDYEIAMKKYRNVFLKLLE